MTTRTVRSDIVKLRSLDYPVYAVPGVGGGYRLGAGAALPPLLLDEEEAVAVAVGLATAAGGSVTGVADASARALYKLEQVLPPRLRRRVSAVQAATTSIPGYGPTVLPDVLAALASACRDRTRVRMDYRTHDAAVSRRDVEPHRLVYGGRRWYLVAWDAARADWRTFRADRIDLLAAPGPRFTQRELPQDIAEYVRRGVMTASWRYWASVQVDAPAPQVAATMQSGIRVEACDEHTCIVHTGADTIAALAVSLGLLERDFVVLEPPELAAHLRRLADRYLRATEQWADRQALP